MIQTVKVDELKPASYNPRKLSDDAQEQLKASLKELGVIKPIVVRGTDMLILAGHQRTKTMKLLGIKECPAFIVNGVNRQDEVRFNQLHNMTEAEITGKMPVVYCKLADNTPGFKYVKNADIEIVKPGEGAKIVELTKMMLRFGQFASSVCDKAGRVLVSSVYAMAAKLNGLDLYVYVLPEGKEQKCVDYFSKEYGEFCYEMIERHTYMQSMAQRMRLRQSSKDKARLAGRAHSTLYEKCVIPYIDKNMRVLDFGAGQKDYAKMLNGQGYKIDAIEFYLRKAKINVIDVDQIEKDFSKICQTLEVYGRYDVVVCDSVLNSVDSKEAEFSVLATLAALCKPGGAIFWSGIPMGFAIYRNNKNTTSRMKSDFHFIDRDKFTANFRNGDWFFQHYHDTSDVIRLNNAIFGETGVIYDFGVRMKDLKKEMKGGSFQCQVANKSKLGKEQMVKAIQFEFSLPLPKGSRWELADRLLPILAPMLQGA